MNTIINNIDFENLEAMKYWSFPKTYSPKRKNKEAKEMCLSGNYIGSRKMDGAWNMIIKQDNEFYLRSRTAGVDGGFTNKIDWTPHIKEELSYLPNGTVLLGEIYMPEQEGSRKITSIFNCLKDKSLQRQKERGWLHYYIFDILAYNGETLFDMPFEKRIKIIYDNLHPSDHVHLAIYFEGKKLWQHYIDTIECGGEGIVITQKSALYLPGKRKARATLKMKKELKETVDVFLDGDYKTPTMEYKGKEIESWGLWYNNKTGERSEFNKFYEYSNGEPWIPVTKAFFNGWASAVSISVMKEGKPYHIGYISGITDEMKEGIIKEPKKYIGQVYEVTCMEIEHTKSGYSLRHGKFVGPRPDKNYKDCEFSQITG